MLGIALSISVVDFVGHAVRFLPRLPASNCLATAAFYGYERVETLVCEVGGV